MEPLRVLRVYDETIADGDGLRLSVYFAGCAHNCPGCHNPDSHDPAGGTEMPVEEIGAQLLRNPLTDGLTLSGGEPFQQAEDCLALARLAHSHGLNVWSYTGYTYESLLSQGTPAQRALLDEIDVLLETPYRLEQRTLALPWRGSANQRVIDLAATRASGAVVLRPD